MAKSAKGNTAIAAAMAKASGLQRPSYVPEESWNEMTDDEKTFAFDPVNKEMVSAVYADEAETSPPSKEEGERAELAVSEGYLPTSLDNVTTDLATKVSEQDREAFVEAVETEMVAKVRTVALTLVIERAFGKGAVALPHYGTTTKDSNNPDIFEYKKKTSKGQFAKKPSEGSVLEITAYKAMVSLGMHNEIKKLEKDIAGLGKGALVPFAWSTRLDEMRERRNKLVKKFIFAVRLVHQLADIAEMKKVGWNWIASDGTTDIADDMSNLTQATGCILLFALGADGQRGMSVALSPSVILTFRVPVANAAGGKLDDLLASIDPGTPEQTEGEAEIKIQNFADATKTLRGVNEYLNKFFGPTANKVDTKAMEGYLLSDAGSETLRLIFLLTETLEEGVVSRDQFRSKDTANKQRIERAFGGNANRQVKDQQDGATQQVA